MGKLAVKSGMWVLWERDHGKLTITGASKAAMKKRIPVADYLTRQGRFKGITDEQIDVIQANVERTITCLQKEVEGEC